MNWWSLSCALWFFKSIWIYKTSPSLHEFMPLFFLVRKNYLQYFAYRRSRRRKSWDSMTLKADKNDGSHDRVITANTNSKENRLLKWQGAKKCRKSDLLHQKFYIVCVPKLLERVKYLFFKFFFIKSYPRIQFCIKSTESGIRIRENRIYWWTNSIIK